jgi:hypothetical protein
MEPSNTHERRGWIRRLLVSLTLQTLQAIGCNPRKNVVPYRRIQRLMSKKRFPVPLSGRFQKPLVTGTRSILGIHLEYRILY